MSLGSTRIRFSPLDVTNTKIYDCFDLFTKLFWWIIWNFENEFFKIAWKFCSIYYVEVRIHANLKTKILVRLSLIVLKFGEAFASPCLWVPPPMNCGSNGYQGQISIKSTVEVISNYYFNNQSLFITPFSYWISFFH